MKFKKRTKSSRMHGSRTHGHSAKLNKGKGSHGGKGMAGTGKRADQKKSKILNKHKGKYFGRQGFTSKKTAKKKTKTINIQDIEKRFPSGEINLSEYKILGKGEITKKFIIRAKSASQSAIDKIKKADGEIILSNKQIKRKIEPKETKEETTKVLNKAEDIK